MIRVIIIAIFFLMGCSSRPVPKTIIAPNEMKAVMIDMIKADEFINTILMKDSSLDLKKRRTELYDQVFTLHKTSHKEFYNSYSYYQQHPDLNKILFDSLINYGNRLKMIIEAADIDTLNKK